MTREKRTPGEKIVAEIALKLPFVAGLALARRIDAAIRRACEEAWKEGWHARGAMSRENPYEGRQR